MKRQAIKSSIASYIGVGIAYITLLVLYPKYLEEEEIGLIRVLVDAGVFFAALASFAFPSILNRYFPIFRQRGQFGLVKGLTITWPVFGFLAFLAVFLTFKDSILSIFEERSPQVLRYYDVGLAIGFFLVIFNAFSALARIYRRIVIPNFLREVGLRLGTLTLLTLLIEGTIAFDDFLNLTPWLYAIAAIITIIYSLLLSKKDPTSFSFSKMDGSFWRDLFTYTGTMALLSMSARLLGTIDSFMISSMLGLGKAGIYGIAFYIGMIIELPKRSVSQISGPYISDAWAMNDVDTLRNIYKETALNQFVIGGLIFTCVWANIDSLFELVPNGEIYAQGKYVVLFIGLAKLFDMSMGVNFEIITNSRYYRFNVYSIIVLIFFLIFLNYAFIPRLGITGAALASLLSLIIFNGLAIGFLSRRIHGLPFSKPWFIHLLIVIFLSTVLYFLNLDLPPILSILIKSFSVGLIYLISIRYLGISPSLNEVLGKLISRFH
ncbi:MAG: oligosaccharide flippase family protein [Bacteroidota bacterium]|nr:oligosaccharide flippase family protein [Bacteroidota bacterium]MDX5428749.1 oligosaccharide flippase family protein [Bacteroidota bacterium]